MLYFWTPKSAMISMIWKIYNLVYKIKLTDHLLPLFLFSFSSLYHLQVLFFGKNSLMRHFAIEEISNVKTTPVMESCQTVTSSWNNLEQACYHKLIDKLVSLSSCNKSISTRLMGWQICTMLWWQVVTALFTAFNQFKWLFLCTKLQIESV